MERISDFSQTDLTCDAAFIVDGYLKIHIWIGYSCVDAVALAASQFARDFAELASKERDMTIDVVVEENGRESLVFQHLFLGWEASLLCPPDHTTDPYEISKKRIRQMRHDEILRTQQQLKEQQQVRHPCYFFLNFDLFLF